MIRAPLTARLAARQYWYTTGDRAWLEAVGFPLANGTASFYAARVQPAASGAAGKWDFNMAMGPDEYAYPVNNSAYSVAAAQIALNFAAEAARELGYAAANPAVYEAFEAKAAGLTVATEAHVPTRPDLVGGYHPEYSGFPRNPTAPQVKQADSIMLAFPLGVDMPAAVLANDLSFYDGITDPNGPAMTWAMFAVGWMTAGDFNRSKSHFLRGFANVQEPFKVWTETPGGGTVNFITGAGGFLQSVLFGSSGMRIGR